MVPTKKAHGENDCRLGLHHCRVLAFSKAEQPCFELFSSKTPECDHLAHANQRRLRWRVPTHRNRKATVKLADA